MADNNSQHNRQITTFTNPDGLPDNRSKPEKGRKHKSSLQKGRTDSGTIFMNIYLIILAALVSVVSLISLKMIIITMAKGASMPFTHWYGVSFPVGKTIKIGDIPVRVLPEKDHLIADIDGERQKLTVNDDKIIPPRRALLTTLGIITLIDTDIQIDLTYKGERDYLAFYEIAVHTSRLVPNIFIRQLLSPDIVIKSI